MPRGVNIKTPLKCARVRASSAFSKTFGSLVPLVVTGISASPKIAAKSKYDALFFRDRDVAL
jgi:hypothetical protein